MIFTGAYVESAKPFIEKSLKINTAVILSENIHVHRANQVVYILPVVSPSVCVCVCVCCAVPVPGQEDTEEPAPPEPFEWSGGE